MLEQLEAVVAGAIIERTRVEAAAATYLVFYRAHLDAEESIMLPRAAELLDTADWVEVAQTVAGKSRDDPLFGAQAEQGFQELRLLIEREAVGATAR